MEDTSGMPRPDALAVLGLSGNASAREITRAYHRLAKRTHPDVTEASDRDAEERFIALTAVYDALTSISSSPAPATTSVPTSAPSPVSPPSATTLLRGPFAVRVRFTSTPIIAGPVRIAPPSRRSP